jgi:prephenate dehydratase
MSGLRVAVAGERGSYAEEAAIALLGEAAVLLSCASFADGLAAVRTGDVDRAVIPVENSITGAVLPATELVERSGLSRVAEVTLAIHHHLVGCPGATLTGIRAVESHPVALAQCGRFLAAHPQIRPVPSADTGTCIRRVVESGDVTRAAIGSLRAAALYGGTVLHAGVQDHPDNWTRFVLLASRS